MLFRKENYRVITSGFLHGDIWHLLFNMFALYLFGKDFELIHGIFLFLLIYFAAILAGSLSGLYNNKNNPDYRAIGASGGVSGIVFASILSTYPSTITIFSPFPISMPDWVFAYLYLGLSFFAMRRINNGIGHDAHLGGAISGIIIISIFKLEDVLLRPYFLGGIIIFIIVLNIIYIYEERNGLIDTEKAWKNYKKSRMVKQKQETELDMDYLLDKVSKHGIESLSNKEKKRLEEISKNI
ncbi:MAG: rhomboid family intramembrane serine protease [Leptospiraceae bacterium]|nr:rhomboid family intramembrane serine protease [Leptospiraceae bacterium]